MFSYRRVWDYFEQEYQDEIERGRRRDARLVVLLWIGLILLAAVI